MSELTYSELDKKRIEFKRAAIYWKNKYEKEKEMKNMWKYAFCTVSFGFVLFIVTVWTVSGMINKPQSLRVPTSANYYKTPDYVLSSVKTYDNGKQGSGTVISKSDKFSAMLSAAHNFSGDVGHNFWVYFADGSYTSAQIVAIDHKRDLALAKLGSHTILANVYVPKTKTKSINIDMVGYTGGEGPIYKKAKNLGSFTNEYGFDNLKLDIKSGTFDEGDSGGGLFNEEDGLIAVSLEKEVMSNKRSYYTTGSVYACSHEEILNFLSENNSKLADCGDWSQKPMSSKKTSNHPPYWKPNSNIPINIESFAEKRIGELENEINDLRKNIASLNDKPKEEVSNLLTKKASMVVADEESLYLKSLK